jgi:hypothetical protein
VDDLGQYTQQKQEDREAGLGPSGVHQCYRQAAYEYLGVPESNPRSTDAADIGTLIHLGWSAMIRAQYSPVEREADVPITVPGLPRKGEADDVWWTKRIVTDLKTKGGYAWEWWRDHEGPGKDVWDQLELYAYGLWSLEADHPLLDEGSPGPWTMRVVAINRDTGQRMEYEQESDPERGRMLALSLQTRHAALTATVAGAVDGIEPLELAEAYPREGKGPGRGFPCDWCAFTDVCWPGSVTGDGTPQSETIRGDEAAIEGWAATYMDAQQAESKAKRAKDDAKAFLTGLDGDYGDYHIAMVGGGKPDEFEVDCNKAAIMLKREGLEVPMKVKTPRKAYVRVTRRKK